ncbi:hypothetical protein ACI5KX_14840 [Erythrobacter sp. GH1-10]|uniref:hypothetical protein n=1 Tax=Erythrobacter sp. GH1-10 TaxID=3349334 RepID=UPI003877B63B
MPEPGRSVPAEGITDVSRARAFWRQIPGAARFVVGWIVLVGLFRALVPITELGPLYPFESFLITAVIMTLLPFLLPLAMDLPRIYRTGDSHRTLPAEPQEPRAKLPIIRWLPLVIGLAILSTAVLWSIGAILDDAVEQFIASREFEGAMPDRQWALWWLFVVMTSMVLGPLSLFAIALAIGSLLSPVSRVIEFRIQVDPVDPELLQRRYDLASIESYADGLGAPQEIEGNLFVAHPSDMLSAMRSSYIERSRPTGDWQSVAFSQTDRRGYSADLSLRYYGQAISARLEVESRRRLERLGIRLLGLRQFDRICAQSEVRRLAQLTRSTVSVEGSE